LSERYRLGVSEDELEELRNAIDEALSACDWIATQRGPRARPVPRGSQARAGYRPSHAENPLGAWFWRCRVNGHADGLLAGYTIAVKDNIPVAGIPMMNGSVSLEGFIPSADALVVERVLDAGGTILGKAVCESLCYSGGSHTSDTGPVRNPYDRTRSSGGSSSGCAALVAAEAVDMALGTDQGGSIRGPSAWCGICGLKPTYGLVPYTGCFPIEMSLDHVGPMARSPREVALLLDAVAGSDREDPRQIGAPAIDVRYSDALSDEIRGVRVGVLEEGFGWPARSEEDVEAAVKLSAGELARLGASVRPASVPMHRHGEKIWCGVAFEGATAAVIFGEGGTTSFRARCDVDRLVAFASGRRRQAHRLPPTVKMQSLIGAWMHETYHGELYAKARNLAFSLGEAYDQALRQHDVLILPTLPMKATPLPASGAGLGERISRALQMGSNTSPFNVTGHPAISIPCAISDGLPVGMMIVGRHGEDHVVLRVAHAFSSRIYSAERPVDFERGGLDTGTQVANANLK
jgi:amidase